MFFNRKTHTILMISNLTRSLKSSRPQSPPLPQNTPFFLKALFLHTVRQSRGRGQREPLFEHGPFSRERDNRFAVFPPRPPPFVPSRGERGSRGNSLLKLRACVRPGDARPHSRLTARPTFICAQILERIRLPFGCRFIHIRSARSRATRSPPVGKVCR